MTAKITDQRLQSFIDKFGRPHLDLACHAALPIALTPDLLYRLWAYFRCDVQGQPLNIPWVAVADVILSPLCDEMGFDLYEIENALRSDLLHRLKTDTRFGPTRLRELADFLLTYHQTAQFHSDDPDLRELAQVQRWSALAQTQPTLVTRDLAQSLARSLGGTAGSESAEWGRLADLIARLSLPDGEAHALLHYTRGMAVLTQGNLQQALSHFRRLPGGGSRGIKVAGVSLALPKEIRPQVQPPTPMTRRHWLQLTGWGTVGVAGTVLLNRVVTSGTSTTPPPTAQAPITPPPTAQAPTTPPPTTQAAMFSTEVVTVGAQGQNQARHQTEVNGWRWTQGNKFVLEVVDIPAGEFEMGAPENEEGSNANERPQHRVNVSAFTMGRYQVTQAQWRFVAEQLEQVNRDLQPDPSYFKGADRPVERVSWEDAVEFCDRLSAFLGTPCRLPSEAEWEYACRAGTTTPFHFGETITPALANYDSTENYRQGPVGAYRQETTPVRSFGVANAFGLYDMHGNVWEWCQDAWHESYEGAPTDGSAWKEDGDEGTRVARGGSWYVFPGGCRSAYRDCYIPRGAFNNIGFRVVCVAPRTL